MSDILLWQSFIVGSERKPWHWTRLYVELCCTWPYCFNGSSQDQNHLWTESSRWQPKCFYWVMKHLSTESALWDFTVACKIWLTHNTEELSGDERIWLGSLMGGSNTSETPVEEGTTVFCSSCIWLVVEPSIDSLNLSLISFNSGSPVAFLASVAWWTCIVCWKRQNDCSLWGPWRSGLHTSALPCMHSLGGFLVHLPGYFFPDWSTLPAG